MESVGAVYKDGQMVAPYGYVLREDGSGLCDPAPPENGEKPADEKPADEPKPVEALHHEYHETRGGSRRR